MNKLLPTLALTAAAITSCSRAGSNPTTEHMPMTALQDSLQNIIKGTPGQFGIAVIFDSRDTLVMNNTPDYPMMSMFKLPEALAVCHMLDNDETGLDTVINIRRGELDPSTWSPMLKDYPDGDIRITAGDLIRYILIDSDNNASNLLFDKIVSVPETGKWTSTLVSEPEFAMMYKESEMKENNSLCYRNRCSPLAYTVLVNKVFTDSIVSSGKQEFIRRAMTECQTGEKRIAAPLAGRRDIKFSHRTGSGYTNDKGEITAVNDGGYVLMPSGKGYSVSVFVKDFAGSQADAEQIMAEISGAIFNYASQRL